MRKRGKGYDPDFKREAVRLVLEEGYSISEVSRRLEVGRNSIGKWVRAVRKDDKKAFAEKEELTSDQKELKKLREEVRQLRMEREILKKATAFFAKEER